MTLWEKSKQAMDKRNIKYSRIIVLIYIAKTSSKRNVIDRGKLGEGGRKDNKGKDRKKRAVEKAALSLARLALTHS